MSIVVAGLGVFAALCIAAMVIFAVISIPEDGHR